MLKSRLTKLALWNRKHESFFECHRVVIDPRWGSLVLAGNQRTAGKFYDWSDSLGNLRGYCRHCRDRSDSLEQNPRAAVAKLFGVLYFFPCRPTQIIRKNLKIEQNSLPNSTRSTLALQGCMIIWSNRCPSGGPG